MKINTKQVLKLNVWTTVIVIVFCRWWKRNCDGRLDCGDDSNYRSIHHRGERTVPVIVRWTVLIYRYRFRLRKDTRKFLKLWIPANMLRDLLSIWNYYIYWWRVCKFISIIFSVGYKTCYKIVIGERNITPDCLGTLWLDFKTPVASLKAILTQPSCFFPSSVQIAY